MSAARERFWRRAAATALTIWLIGWGPSIYFSQAVQGGPNRMPQLYAIWIFLGPLALTCLFSAGWALAEFYRWALGGPPPEELERRIDTLERELGIR